jgi:hypothetical protein
VEDEAFRSDLARSARSIGSAKFRAWVDDSYRKLSGQRSVPEDVSFRRTGGQTPWEAILAAVAGTANIAREELSTRRRDCRWRAVAGRMLCRYGGLTQRAVAPLLGLRTGVAVSCQLQRLNRLMDTDPALRKAVEALQRQLPSPAS